MAREFTQHNLPFERQVELPLMYEGEDAGVCFRADFIVGGVLLVELKAVDKVHPLHGAQVLTYLRIAGLQQGLLINFNVPILRHGIKSYLNRPVEHRR